ncbi:MAG: pyridoxal phosphate-dependent aminotransferase [Eubacteriales bacterium]|nr:pyridoxal phosphate-dependent aminotransferase [Eubacteriales bacterium]
MRRVPPVRVKEFIMRGLASAEKYVTNSPIRKLFNKAAGMTDVIAFTVGEPDFNTPKYIVDAAIESLKNGKAHHYPPNAGINELRAAVTKETEKTLGVKFGDPIKNAMITCGGMEALSLAFHVLVDPGDEVILGDPSYCNYSRMVYIQHATPVFVPCYAKDNFCFDLEALEKAITPKTKAILINSPANPTGGIAGVEQLKKIAELAIKHDLYVFSDEVYNSLTYDGNKAVSIASLPGMLERTVIINSFSKKYAMCGWRVGYAMAREDIVDAMSRFQENIASGVNGSAQYAAVAALEGPQDDFEEMLRQYTRRRNLVVEEFNKIPGLKCFAPQGTFYAFIDVSGTGMDGNQFAEDVLEKVHVIVVPGDTFGTEGKKYVRLVFATSEDRIKEGIRRIGKYMEER